MKLTQQTVKALLPGQTMVIQCDDVCEYESVARVAYFARTNLKIPKENLKISQQARQLTVTIQRT